MNSSKTAPKVELARHWINGEWIGSSTVANSISPSTAEVLGQYSAGGRTEAASAIAAARKAFDAGVWSHDPQLRSRALLELADRLDERADAIALTISREEGKTLGEATLEATFVSDASGGVTREAHEMGIQRMIQAGAIPLTWGVLSAEWQRDWAREATVSGLAQIVVEHYGATGTSFLWEQQLLNQGGSNRR